MVSFGGLIQVAQLVSKYVILDIFHFDFDQVRLA